MRIIFAGGYKTPDFGGVNSYMLCLSKQLISLGHECMVIRQGTKDERDIIDDVTFISLGLKGPRSLGFFLFNVIATWYIIKNRIKADVICFQSCYWNNFLCLFLKRKGYKVTCVIHSFACDNPKNSKLAGKVLLMLERLSTIGYHNIITVGRTMEQKVTQRLKKKAWIVRGGIFPPSNDDNTSLSVLSKLNLNSDGYYLTMARIEPVKKLEVLIEGFKKYKGDKKLVIGGNMQNAYGKLLEELAADDPRIVLPGSVFGEDKEDLLKHCFAYCLVSSSEGFPISLLEAMSYGKRSIVSRIDPNIEMLGEENGVWCEVDSKEDITKALLDMDRQTNRDVIEERIKNRVTSNFTWDKSADSFINAIRTFNK